MLLAIDIGNSQIVSGVFEAQDLQGVWRWPTDKEKTLDDFKDLYDTHMSKNGIQVNQISACIMSSVVPQMTPTLASTVRSYFKQLPEVVSLDFPFGLTLGYDNPQEIGMDRLVNAAAGFDRYRCNLIIVDFGTATTFCAITEEGKYLGGAIAPGLKSAGDSMHRQTAQLPQIDLVQPKTAIGTNTVGCMQSGLIYGYVGLVDELVSRIQGEIGKKAYVLATGGLGSLVSPNSRTIQEIRPNLTLEGLELLHRRLHSSCG